MHDRNGMKSRDSRGKIRKQVHIILIRMYISPKEFNLYIIVVWSTFAPPATR